MQGCPTDTNLATPKEWLKEVAELNGCNLSDLLCLASANDPFNCGSPTDISRAQWLANICSQLNVQRGFHLRRLHYKLAQTVEGLTLADGKTPYLNTDKCWQYLQIAAAKARYLGLVDPQDIVDRRNPNPKLYAVEPHVPEEPSWWIDDFGGFFLPRIETDLTAYLELPGINVSGYDFDDGDQPYRLELWVEKSTMNDVLDPICGEYRVNYVTSVGFGSITSVINLLQRLQKILECDRPTRIFYGSDFDPAGQHMPSAIARQIQFWLWKYGIKADVKLNPLFLTGDQVAEFDLPRIPIKDSDLRKNNFELKHGEGAVELDALEAIYPGKLAEIVSAAILSYRDPHLSARMDEARYEAETIAEDTWDTTKDAYSEAIEKLQEEVDEVVAKYRPRLDELSAQMDSEMQPLRERAEQVEAEARWQLEQNAESLDIDLPERPEAEIDKPDEDDWLFDSTRNFEDQNDYWQR